MVNQNNIKDILLNMKNSHAERLNERTPNT